MKKTGEKQQLFDENFFKKLRRRENLGPILLWTAAFLSAALVLGWYGLDSGAAETGLRRLEPGLRRAEEAPLDLNRATAAELEDLPGIGPVLAERIVAWRSGHGPFSRPEDVTAVPGVGPAVYEAIAPYIGVRQEDGS